MKFGTADERNLFSRMRFRISRKVCNCKPLRAVHIPRLKIPFKKEQEKKGSKLFDQKNKK